MRLTVGSGPSSRAGGGAAVARCGLWQGRQGAAALFPARAHLARAELSKVPAMRSIDVKSAEATPKGAREGGAQGAALRSDMAGCVGYAPSFRSLSLAHSDPESCHRFMPIVVLARTAEFGT